MRLQRVYVPCVLCLGAVTLSLFGCAAGGRDRLVRSGDRVSVNFTCRESSGAIAASTYPEVNDSTLRKSALYLKRSRKGPVTILAGEDAPFCRGKSFEDEVLASLSSSVVGLEPGQAADLMLDAKRQPDQTQSDHKIRIARIRFQAKEYQMATENFKRVYRTEPKIGMRVPGEPVLLAEVTGVSDTAVVIRYSAPGSEAMTPFGPALITSTKDRYRVEIQAVKGALIRTGGSAGRISDFDADYLTIDYGHPFGGEALRCSVTVESVLPGEQTGQAGASHPAGAAQVGAKGGAAVGSAVSGKPGEGASNPGRSISN